MCAAMSDEEKCTDIKQCHAWVMATRQSDLRQLRSYLHLQRAQDRTSTTDVVEEEKVDKKLVAASSVFKQSY